MIKRRPNIEQERETEWMTVARHDFEAERELDATIITAIADRDCLEAEPLYRTVDVESAEQFLAATDGDASVVFPVSEHTVRVSTDGTVQVRQEPGDALDVGSAE